MCGIFGLISAKSDYSTSKIFKDLFLLSESRGKEAAGFAIIVPERIRVYKTPFSASTMVKSRVFKNEIISPKGSIKGPFVGIGHSRLVTNGYEQYEQNNQPIIKNGMVVVHNGIIVNNEVLWEKFKSGKKETDLDSELIPVIIDHQYKLSGSYDASIKLLFDEIIGMTNIALLSSKFSNLILATNNGSIYYYEDVKNQFFVFASEEYIIRKLLSARKIEFSTSTIMHLTPQEMISVNYSNFTSHRVKLGQPLNNIKDVAEEAEIELLKNDKSARKIYINTSLDHSNIKIDNTFEKEYYKRQNLISQIRRCTKCILPETFPFIEFDENGVCNYCHGYQKIDYLGEDNLKLIATKIRKSGDQVECLVPFSGGRDSSYSLHYIVKNLGLKPIAFSYDWGMLTDLARRNQSRVCGKLGIEHILVSADIRNKRKNIRKNVSAWLKRPDLGTIPLFMAGDKQYFYHAQKLKKQLKVDLVIMGENHLERTLFKTAFSGAKQESSGYMAYHISPANKIRMLEYYLKQFIINPSFLNSSLIDTAGSFLSYYTIKHDYLNLFNYVKWDEQSIQDLLKQEYDWETDPGTSSTWRIGDGTASFYNYIYYLVAGFTENDTFRSNQIREGDLSRNAAIQLSLKENAPRWDSIQWYCRTIGLDFSTVVQTINQIPSLYDNY